MRKALLTGVAALSMPYAMAAHARPELSKEQSWKLIQGTWCVDQSDETLYGISRNECTGDELKLIIKDKGFEYGAGGYFCKYVSGKARFDKTIPASTKTVGVYIFHITVLCTESGDESWKSEFDMYVSKGTLVIKNMNPP
jgi:hypothetical protein